MNMLIIASALHSCMNSRSAPVAPGTQQALNTCVLFEKQNKTCAVCPPSEPKAPGQQELSCLVLFAVMVACLGDILMGAPSVPSPRNITESSDMTVQVSAVGTLLFPGQFEMNITVGRNTAGSDMIYLSFLNTADQELLRSL